MTAGSASAMAISLSLAGVDLSGKRILVTGASAGLGVETARALAAHYGLPHLDTGLLYRAVGRQCALAGGNPDDPAAALAAAAFLDSLLADPALRSEESGGLASRVSVHPGVRRALYDRQRAFALQPGQYSAVIQDDTGYHLLYVVERDPARQLSPDALLALQGLALQNWLTQKRSESTIVLAP